MKQIGLAFMNYESANTCFSPTTILVPLPTGAAGSWAYESSWSAFARSSPFLEQGAFYNAINFDFTYSGAANTTVEFTPLAFLYCPSDPGIHFDDASLGGTGDGDDELWHVRRRLVCLVGKLGRDQLRRPDEPLVVWAQLRRQNRHGDRRHEQHANGFRRVHRPRPDEKLQQVHAAPLLRTRLPECIRSRTCPPPAQIRPRP